MELRQRKKMRLQGYDYGRAGYYFITICVAERAELLGRVVEECRGAHCAPAYVTLSDVGRTVEHVILQIPEYHKGVCVDKYVIMPNHIHMILTLAEFILTGNINNILFSLCQMRGGPIGAPLHTVPPFRKSSMA